MELPYETIVHLRCEALAARCRAEITGELADLERQAEDLRGTRSPFTVFARRETREARTRSLQAIADKAADARDRLAQVEDVERRLGRQLQADLEANSEQFSADYLKYRRSVRMIDAWQHKLREQTDTLIAFARELKNLRSPGAAMPAVRAVAAVRELAQRLEAAHQVLTGIARDATAVIEASASAHQLPALPVLRRMAWVQRLTFITAQQADVESTLVETETRRFLACGLEAAQARAVECRSALQAMADRYLEQYWNQLRAHANEYYISESDCAAAREDLIARYVTAEVVSCQTELCADPFPTNR
jgi:hypothetical protein